MSLAISDTKVTSVSKSAQPGKIKLLGTLVFSLVFSTCSPFVTLPVVSQTPNPPATSSTNSLGQQLLQQIYQCLLEKVPEPQTTTPDRMQIVASECVLQHIMLDSSGKYRPDASDRFSALIEVTRVKFPQQVTRGKANVQLNFLAANGIFTVPVKIGNQTQNFLLDTGSGQTIIDSQIAQQIALRLNQPMIAIPSEVLKHKPVIGNNLGQAQASVNILPPLSIQSASVSGLYGLGLPTDRLPTKISGILGLDFLSNFDVVLNPRQRQLQLLSPSPTVKGAIPLTGSFGVLTTQVYINGEGPFRFIVDTGASAMILSKRLAQRLNLDDPRIDKTEEVFGFGGSEKVKKIKLAKLNVQQHQAYVIDALILETSPLLKVPGVEGVIGQNFLNRYKQHWRFSKRNGLGLVEAGSLVLTPY
jgi:predicted aspartyl protease